MFAHDGEPVITIRNVLISTAAKDDTAVSSAVTTLVAGCAANVTADVTGSDLSGLSAKLFGKTAAIVDGKAKFNFAAADVPIAGAYSIEIVNASSAVVAKTDITVVNQPADLWTPKLTNGTGEFSIAFGAPVSFSAAAKSVKIGGVAVSDSLISASGNAVTVKSAVTAGQSVVISGVKYATLFPSYTFTFTITA